MGPMPEEKQNDQTQERQRQGIISHGIGSKIASRVVVQTALRGFAAFVAGPGLPIAIAIVSVFVFTLIIVLGFGGAPLSEMNVQAPPTAPTLAPTLSPAVP